MMEAGRLFMLADSISKLTLATVALWQWRLHEEIHSTEALNKLLTGLSKQQREMGKV